jgi:transglutaminase-like putative cysteine protease
MGSLFVLLTVSGAFVLTSVAIADPLARAWRDLQDDVGGLSPELSELLGTLGIRPAPRPVAGLFGSTAEIRFRWDLSDEPIYRYRGDDEAGHYLRGAAFDELSGGTWKRSDDAWYDVAAGASLLDGSTDAPGTSPERRPVRLDVGVIEPLGPTALLPEGAERIDRDARVWLTEEGGPLSTIQVRDAPASGSGYAVEARVHDYGRRSETLDQAVLSEPVSARPASVDRTFLDHEPGRFPLMEAEVARVVEELIPPARRDRAYQVAKTIQDYLRGELRLPDRRPFVYDADVSDVYSDGTCDPALVPECLVTVRRGFCQQFATTMVMMLRSQGIPARYVQGFLPGEPEGPSSYLVRAAAAHAWVEAWFDGTGWVRFDPTPLLVPYGQVPTDLPQGRRPPGAPDGPEPSSAPTFAPPTPEPTTGPIESSAPGSGEAAGSGSGPVEGLLLAVTILLLVAFGVAGLAVRRLRHLADADPERAYRGIVSLASRVGHAPQASQTELEYAGTLSAWLPAARDDLQLVARARVESRYGPRGTVGHEHPALRDAYARVRTALLRLFLRRQG